MIQAVNDLFHKQAWSIAHMLYGVMISKQMQLDYLYSSASGRLLDMVP